MDRKLVRNAKVLVLALGLLWLAAQAGVYFLLRQDRLLDRIEHSLTRGLAEPYGIGLRVESLKAGPGLGLEAAGIALADLRQPGSPVVARAAHAYIRLNPFRLITGFRHPESAVGEFLLDRVEIRIDRGRDGSWLWERFTASGRKLLIHPVIRLHEVVVDFRAAPLPHPIGRVRLPEAVVDLRAHPRIRAGGVLRTDLDPALRLEFNGIYDLARRAGWADLAWQEASLPRWQASGWLPAGDLQMLGGALRGRARLALGPRLGLESGFAVLAGGRVRIPGLVPGTVAVQGRADLAGRRLRIRDLALQTSRGSLAGTLQCDLEAKNPMVRGDLQLKNLELGQFAAVLNLPPKASLGGRVSGRLAVAGRLAGPSMSGRLSLFGGTLSYPPLPAAEEGGLRGRFAGRALRVDSIRARLGGGRVTGSGSLLFLPSLNLEMDLRATGITAGELLDGLGQPGWRGRIDAKGRLAFAAGRWSIGADLDWAGLSWRGRALPGGNASVKCTSRGGEMDFDLTGRIGRGGIEARGRRTNGRWHATGRIRDVGLGPLASFMPAGLRDLDGTATADLLWRSGEGDPDLSITGRARTVRIGGRVLDEVIGSLRWSGREIIVQAGQARMGRASASLSGRFDTERDEVSLDLALHRVPLASFVDGAGGLAEGRLRLMGRWPSGLSGAGWAHLQDLSWQGTPLGLADLDLELAGDRVRLRRAHLESADGRADLSGELPLSDRGALDLVIGGFDWEAASLARLFTAPADLRGRIKGEGRVTGTWRAPAAEAHLEAGPGEVYDLQWRKASADLRLAGQRIIVERASATLAGMEVIARGAFGPAGWDLKVEAPGADLAAVMATLPYEPPYPFSGLGGQAAISARIGGPLSRPSLAGEAAVKDLVLGGFVSEHLALRFSLDGYRLQIQALQASTGEQQYTASGSVDLATLEASLVFTAARGDLAGLLALSGQRLPWPVRGRVTGEARLEGSLRNPTCNASLTLAEGMIGEMAVSGELGMRYDGSTLTLDGLRLEHEQGELTAVGRFAAAKFSLAVAGRDLPLGEIASLAGLRDIQGRGNLQILLDRSGGAMQGRFQLQIHPGSLWAGIPLESVAVEGEIKDRAIVLTRGEMASGGHLLSAAGRFPLPPLGSLERFLQGVPPGPDRLELRIDGTDLPLPILNPILPGAGLLKFTSGRITLAAVVGGTWNRPEVEGAVYLSEAEGRASVLPDPFRHLNIEARLAGQTLHIEKARAELGTGAAGAAGTIALGSAGLAYDLRIQGNAIRYKNSFFDGSISSARLALKGSPLPAVSGTLEIGEGKITLGPAEPKAAIPPLPLDVRLVAGGDVRFSFPAVADVPVSGELRVGGTLSSPTLDGMITATRGSIYVYGERFNLTAGIATFAPSRGYLPYVELQGNKAVRDFKIFMSARGEITAAGLPITLWSEPPLSQQEILDLLRWSAPPGIGESAPEVGKFFLGGLELVMDTVFGELSEDFRRLLDADSVELGLDQSGALSLQMGKYVLEDFYLSYQMLFDQFSTRIWSFNFYITPQLVLNGVFSTTEGTEWSLTYQYAF